MTGGSAVPSRRRLTRSQTVSLPDAKKSHRGKAKTSLRGYGTRHQKIRKTWAPRVATGTVKCARCGKLIERGEPWDLGHDDYDRDRYTGPEHRRCNRATTGRQSPRSRKW